MQIVNLFFWLFKIFIYQAKMFCGISQYLFFLSFNDYDKKLANSYKNISYNVKEENIVALNLNDKLSFVKKNIYLEFQLTDFLLDNPPHLLYCACAG